jgi:(p)ppGpp synthase/HD superfamily hydrolase
MEMLKLSIETAERYHEGQKRKYTGLPYTTHTQRVAEIYTKLFPDDIVGQCVAHLHDTVEDTKATYASLRMEFASFREVNELISGIAALTDVYTSEAYPCVNRAERKILERDRLSKIATRWKNIKLCDMIDNCEDIVVNDKDFARTYLQEKHNILMIFKDADKRLWDAANAMVDWGMFRVVL